MRPRTLLIIVVVDVVLIAGFAIWMLTHTPRTRADQSTHPPSASAAVTVANAPAASAPATASVPATSAPRVAFVTALPALATDQRECHGEWNGEPFWARLSPATAATGVRQIQLLWTPPSQKALGGAVIGDCPLVYLDTQGLLHSYDSRFLQTNIVPRSATSGYRVDRDTTDHESSKDAAFTVLSRTVTTPRAWDLRLLPLHLALSWRAGSTGSVRAVDFFAATVRAVNVQWTDRALRVGDEQWTIDADARGRLSRITAPDGQVVLVIRTWISGE